MAKRTEPKNAVTPKKNAKVSALARVAAAKKAEAVARKKKRGEALVALVERRRARIVEDFYDIGEALREILRDQLYEAMGSASFAELVQQRRLMSPEQANKLVWIVERVPREQALRAGMEKSYALISFANATSESDDVGDLIRRDAVIGGEPVSEASVRDIRAAARKARPAKRPVDRARAARERELIALARALLSGPPKATLSVEGDFVVARWSVRALGKLRPE